MPLTITWRIEESLAIMELAGALTLGPSLLGLRETARQILRNNKVSSLAIRVANVTVTDSSGLGELTVIYTIATNRGCGVRLLDVTPSLRRMLRITCIDELLPE